MKSTLAGPSTFSADQGKERKGEDAKAKERKGKAVCRIGEKKKAGVRVNGRYIRCRLKHCKAGCTFGRGGRH